jgi:hypothetical protein
VFEGAIPELIPIDMRRSGASWIELQEAVVTLAAEAEPQVRRELASALLHAVLQQHVLGGSNLLSTEAFALICDATPDELAAGLEPAAASQSLGMGGQRFLHEHAFMFPGPEGPQWLSTLARADDMHAGILLQKMAVGELPCWSDEDWSGRLDALAQLHHEPRPGVVNRLLGVCPPRVAMPAFVRLVIAHGVDERDPLVRHCASCLRDQRTSPADGVDLVDWEARHCHAELFRWMLELSGAAGERSELVAAAHRAGRLPAFDAKWLSEPLARPAWADAEVPWEVVSTAVAGELTLPSGELTGGDPWWFEGLPWTIHVPPGSYSVYVVVASHPLARHECAALELVLDEGAAVDMWELVLSAGVEQRGYTVAVGVASFGAPAAYEAVGDHFEIAAETFFNLPQPAWATADGKSAGTVVYCSVGPQHQLCRTWLGTSSGRPVAVVTDLGLLELDLVENPVRPWSS